MDCGGIRQRADDSGAVSWLPDFPSDTSGQDPRLLACKQQEKEQAADCRNEKTDLGRPEIGAHFVSFNFPNNPICVAASTHIFIVSGPRSVKDLSFNGLQRRREPGRALHATLGLGRACSAARAGKDRAGFGAFGSDG
jgi:hypothetical protein